MIIPKIACLLKNHSEATEMCETMVNSPIQNTKMQLNTVAYGVIRIHYRHLASLRTFKNAAILRRGRGRSSSIAPRVYK